jgi:uncharacterized protein (TIGR02147 family)
MAINQLEKPQIQNYLNVHHYLGDLYTVRKNNEPGFSYESWAQELDLKSRSFLRQVVIGRRGLTENLTKLFCDRLNLQGTDREYFELLVQYSNSKNQQIRNLYGKKLMQLIKTDFAQTEIENYYELVATTLHPKILTLLTFKDIKKDSTTITRLLGAEEEEVQTGLKALERLKLIELNEKTGEWQATQKQVKVPDLIGDVALLDYHAQSLQEAIAAQVLPKDQRRYKALLLPFSSDEFSEFLEDLQVFVKQTMKKFDTDDLITRKLHQVNFNVYTVSESPDTVE